MRVWVDTDVALGARFGDVDDGFALAALSRARNVELLGVSTVFGNTTAQRATSCARRLVSVEVVEGAARAGEDSAAAEAIAALPSATVLLALGPLTNLARAIARNPALSVEVRLVGGNLASLGRWPPVWPFEFNLARDAPAARAVFASSLPRQIYPLDACRALTVGPRALLGLARARDPLANVVAHGSWRWLAYAPLRYRALSFPLWDLVPALDLCGILDGRFDLRRLRCAGYGRLVADAAAPEALCLRSFDGERALARFLTLMGA